MTRRVLFRVERATLGEQPEKEFQSYVAPDINRKFTELYNVQRLTSNTIAMVTLPPSFQTPVGGGLCHRGNPR